MNNAKDKHKNKHSKIISTDAGRFPAGILQLLILMAMLASAGAYPANAAGTASSTYTSSEDGNVALISTTLINQDPDPALSGDIVEVRIGIENTGGAGAQDQVIEIDPEYPFSLVPGEDATQYIGTVQGYQTTTTDTANMRVVKFRLLVDKDASAGTYNLNVLHYAQDSTVKQKDTLSIDVNSKEIAEIINIDKTVIVPGKQSGLKFQITNVGNSPLNDITFSWKNSDGVILPVGSDNTKHIKNIGVRQSADVEYQVIADTNADSGLYQLDLTLSFTDSSGSGTTTMSTIAGIYIGGGTDFDVAYSESSGSDVSFSIANVGSNTADSVLMVIPEQNGWTISGSNTAIIGNLNKGDYTVASFSLSSSSSNNQSTTQGSSQSTNRNFQPNAAQGFQRNTNSTGAPSGMSGASADSSGKIKVQVVYTNTMGERITVEKDVKMNTQSSGSSSGSLTGSGYSRNSTSNQSFFTQYKWYLIGGAVLLVVIFGYLRYKKRKEAVEDAGQNFKMKDFFKAKKK
jgi:hypothetical protein